MNPFASPTLSATFSLLLLAPAWSGAAQDEDEKYTAVKCGKDTVVLFDDTKSPDGRYVLGWTIRPADKDAKPVDWTKLDQRGFEFCGDYDWCRWDHEHTPYVLIDGVVDSVNHTFTPLPTDYSHDSLAVTHNWCIKSYWLDSKFAVVMIDARFYTSDVFLLTLDKNGIGGIKNLVEGSNPLVRKMAGEKRPLAPAMDIIYDNPEASDQDEVLTLSFEAWLPKGSYEDFDGHLIVSLPEGNPAKVVSQDEADKPFDGKLGEADQQLNAIYAKLKNKLGKEELKKLKAKQSAWIEQRNESACREAGEKVRYYDEDSTKEKYLAVRNAKALKLTNQRIQILRKQLDGK